MGRVVEDELFLYIPRCTSVHTCFMRRAIDLLFVDTAGVIVGVAPAVPPWRIRFGPRGTSSVVELPAGYTQRHAMNVGDQVICP